MKHKIIKLSSLILVPLFLISEVQATIYKCVKANTDVFYNDKPCPVTDKQSQIKSAKDPEGGYISPRFISENEQSSAKGIVIGPNSERTIYKNEKVKGDNSNKVNNGSAASSSVQSQSKGSKNSSKTNSQSKSNQDSSEKNANANYPVKNIIHTEGDYKKESDYEDEG